MKFFYAPILALASIFAATASSQTAQTPSSQAPAQTQQQKPAGQVIFSRSIDENGQATTTAGPAAKQSSGTAVTEPIATDEEREAVRFASYDLDVHLNAVEHKIAVRAVMTVRNDGKAPLKHVPLQISSSLAWEQIRMAGRDVAFTVATLNSDVDHTGQLHEAAITLDEPLAQGAALQVDATYSGTIEQDAKRLTTLGTPDATALHSDWDAVGEDFTGLRGFGEVVWYPVASVPVILGDGARVFDEMGEHKLHMAGTRFSMKLTDEFPRGQAPTIALINGHVVPLKIVEPELTSEEASGFALASVEGETLGFEAPSLFVAIRKAVKADNVTLWTLPADEPAVRDWSAAATAVTPFLQGWLGEHPRSQLTILDLPDADDAPYETGAMLAAPIREATADELDEMMAHGLAHAWLETATHAPPAWIDEGLAHFMGTLWLEKRAGRTKALESLEANRQALALAEPASPGESAGQPLAEAIAPIYYRTKAAYVFWMLRDLAGDEALAAALRDYDPAMDVDAKAGVPTELEKLIEKHAQRDLRWFFADWVDADKGLPDIAIDNVFPTAASAGNTLVAVNLSNAGYAAAEVAVTVQTDNTSVTQRMLVPGRGRADRRILIQGTPTQVQANDGVVPEVQASVHIKRLRGGNDDTPPLAQPGGVQK
ncbi:MAG TPA: M1 family aminopeptidase [Terracidiphilus sp.]|nr:M1 family aminopeptidase [Terracidiphilus sp.]